jgi:transcriptional regulator with GAF, ATPase, and Fis domain
MVSGIYMNLSAISRAQGKIEASIEYTQKAIEGFETLQDIDMVYRVKGNLANIYLNQSQFSQALELKNECISYFESQNNRRQLGLDYNAVSIIYRHINRLDKAIEFALKSVTIREELQDFASLAHTWLNLGSYYNESGKDVEALEMYTKSLELFSAVGDKSCVGQTSNNIGNIHLAQGNHQLALDYFISSFQLATEIDEKHLMAVTLENMGIIYSQHLNDPAKGLECYTQASALAEQIQDLYLYVTIQYLIVEVQNLAGQYESSLAQLEQVSALVFEYKLEKLYARLHYLYADSYAGTGKYQEALEAKQRYCLELEKQHKAESIAKIAEMQTKYETEKKEKEAELLRQKNQEIEEQKAQLQDTLDKLQDSEIRYNFVSEELTKNIRTTLIGTSEATRSIIEMISVVAHSDKTNVLITGETGTGKEIVARNIHACSKRSKNHFYAVNCSAVPDTLFESQFFGHEKDAFTGANAAKIGWFEIADKSTLFLDEVCSLSPEQQSKLLRVLEERSIVRVGSHREIPIDVRIISAANCNLLDKVNEGLFRRDLYHRLAIFVIHIPPLRERKEEIPLLLHHFVGLTGISLSKTINKIEKDIAVKLLDYDFPGNIRELRNMVERAVLLAGSSTLRLEHFLIPGQSSASAVISGNLTLEELEKQLLIKTLKATGFNRVQTAKILDVNRKVIERKIKKHNITEDDL